MNYREYVSELRDYEGLLDISEYGTVTDDHGDHPLLVMRSPGTHLLVITAGFHGDEQAGPLTLLRHTPEIVESARARDVGLVVFPCVNPSGFDAFTRYNRLGERPNNDFLRYEVAPREWVGELRPGKEQFIGYRLFDGGPVETRALREAIVALPKAGAALDIHQDPYIKGSLCYAYTFGDHDAYRPLMEKSALHATVAREHNVDVGLHTDVDGFIVFHDGSVTDYFARLGVPYAVALETTTDTPPDECDAVNLAWIHGFIELAARG